MKIIFFKRVLTENDGVEVWQVSPENEMTPKVGSCEDK